MNKKTMVSVIIIIYNRKPTEQLKHVINHLNNQTIKPEIILCEQNDKFEKKFDNYCKENNIVHIKIRNDNEFGNMGYLKNMGIINAKGKYLYFLDSDMIILNDDYLEKLVIFMEQNDCKALVHPKMLRLKNNADKLIGYKGVIGCVPNNKCYCDYDNENKCLISNYKEHYKFFNNLTHVSIDQNLWQLNFHSGSIFIKKNDLVNLGGYSLKYYHWGMDDIDTQWKINEKYGARNISEIFPSMYLLHFEHKVFNENSDHKNNRVIFKQRFDNGLDNSIYYDIDEYKKMINGVKNEKR